MLPIEYIIYAISRNWRMISMLMDGFRQAVIFSELLQSLYSIVLNFQLKKYSQNQIVKKPACRNS
jgi:hypothetical protein